MTTTAPIESRRGYLDWLRGVAVLIMIEAHTVDSWTRAADRAQSTFGWALVVGGFGAPIFLFLAGVALALAAGARQRRGLTPRQVAARARARGWQIFGLAFLFRLQSMLISGGGLSALLKVDILNIMGLAMLLAAVIWGVVRRPLMRTTVLAAAAAAVAMATPLVRDLSWLAPLPDPIESYLRSPGGRTTFTLFPWAGFLLAGAAIGGWIDGARTPGDERRLNGWLVVVGLSMALLGYATSLLPSIYRDSSFWTSSPTFFVLRLGILIASVPLAFAWERLWPGRSPLREFGVASLFVYWIHVEMVYGVASAPLHRALSLGEIAFAFAAFSAFLYLLVKLRNRFIGNPMQMPGAAGGNPRTATNSLAQ